jgi:hypothetical protein
LFQLLIHESPWNRTPLGAISQAFVTPTVFIVRPATAKIDWMLVKRWLAKIKAFFRVAVVTLERSRTGRAVLAGVLATSQSLGRVLHQLWLEVTGFTFLVMAAVGAMAGIREFGKYQARHASGPGRLLLAICFTLSFAWFGVTSFWRVKRRAKS